MGGLDDAAARYWATVAELEALKAQIPAVRLRMAAEREELVNWIIREAKAGVSQVELAQRAGYRTREMVRRILRQAGFELDKD